MSPAASTTESPVGVAPIAAMRSPSMVTSAAMRPSGVTTEPPRTVIVHHVLEAVAAIRDLLQGLTGQAFPVGIDRRQPGQVAGHPQ